MKMVRHLAQSILERLAMINDQGGKQLRSVLRFSPFTIPAVGRNYRPGGALTSLGTRLSLSTEVAAQHVAHRRQPIRQGGNCVGGLEAPMRMVTQEVVNLLSTECGL